jgi:ribonuclease P protein component
MIFSRSITGTAGNNNRHTGTFLKSEFFRSVCLISYRNMNMVERQSFTKDERLCRTKLIKEIFENGNVFYSSQFRVSWIISSVNLPAPAQVAISVPKKSFRLAVTRNLIKRRIREAYRKNKHLLYNCLAAEEIQLAFILIFRQNRVSDYQTLEKSVKETIGMLCELVSKTKKKS